MDFDFLLHVFRLKSIRNLKFLTTFLAGAAASTMAHFKLKSFLCCDDLSVEKMVDNIFHIERRPQQACERKSTVTVTAVSFR